MQANSVYPQFARKYMKSTQSREFLGFAEVFGWVMSLKSLTPHFHFPKAQKSGRKDL